MTSSNGFPKYTKSAKTGDFGIGLVADIVSNQLGWNFRRTHQEHDFGIDGYIDIVEPDGSVTGKMLAVQIKTGGSYTKKLSSDHFEYVGEQKHLNYYANHPIPILLVICDPVSRQCFWEYFEVAKTDRKSGGWSILIPITSVFNRDAQTKLRALVGESVDFTRELEEFWSLNQIVDSSKVFIFSIGRPAIEAGRTEGIVNLFSRVSRNAVVAKANMGKIGIHIYGYDDDSRELFEIPEVRRWFQLVEPLVRNWFFYLTSNGTLNSLKLLAACVCEIQSATPQLGKPPGNKLHLEIRGKDLAAFMERHFRWLNEFTDNMGFGIDINKKVSFDAMRALDVPEEFLPML